MCHSQHNIEAYLNHFFREPGFFLEIGCWDGELISQTAWLEWERGWTGLCVDPFARHFERRSCMVCRKAVSDQPSAIREFVKVSKDRRNGGDVSYFSGFIDVVKAKRHWDLISQHCDYELVEVLTITMEDLYTEYELPAYIDFLSVDTEGSELEIFESIDFKKWSYGMIMFEHNEDDTVRRRVGNLLKSNDYLLVGALHLDDVYVSRKVVETGRDAYVRKS